MHEALPETMLARLRWARAMWHCSCCTHTSGTEVFDHATRSGHRCFRVMMRQLFLLRVVRTLVLAWTLKP